MQETETELCSKVIVPIGNGTFKVTDLDTAIFVYYRSQEDDALGISFRDAVKIGEAKHDVVFSGELSVAHVLELEFVNGYQVSAVGWCNAQRNLKRVIRRHVDARFGQGRAKQR